MSFTLNAQGTKDEALEQLENATGSGDTQHFEVCRDALRAAIESAPDDTVIAANASGHHDYNTSNPNGSFQLSFSIKKVEQPARSSRKQPDTA